MQTGTLALDLDLGIDERHRPTLRIATPTLQEQYEALRSRTERMSGWLSGPLGDALSEAEWNERFARYQQSLAQLRRLGDQLRPITLRDRQETLSGSDLSGEIMELFAA